MKTLPCLVMITTMAWATATAASAYHLSPTNIIATLKGTLTYTANEGGQPFTCKTTMILRTSQAPRIKDVSLPAGDCEGLFFGGLPWGVQINNSNSGEFGIVEYGSGSGNCSGEIELFQVNKKGVWTLTGGQCVSGILKSDPPVTIVP